MGSETEFDLEIPDALRNLEGAFVAPIEGAADEIADGIVGLYKGAIEGVGAVATGRFRDMVHVRTATRSGEVIQRVIASERKTDSGIFLSGIIEFGWDERADGQGSYPGRFPALLAVENAGPVISDAFDNQFARIGIRR
jgi:hypothetical protein